MIRKKLGKIGNESEAKRYRRKLALRKKINGTAERPRLCVLKSNKHLTVQAIDDVASKTLFSVQTYGKAAVKAACNVDGAKTVGATVAEKLKAANITTAVFDRNGYRYHGVVAALVDSARENGIKI